MNDETEKNNQTENPDNQNNTVGPKRWISIKAQFVKFPVTMSIISLTGIIFLLLNIEKYLFHGTTLFSILAPNKISLFNGYFWGILSNQLVHIDVIHWFFNMYCVFLIGRPLEMIYGKKLYLRLVLFSGLAASLAQTLLSVSAGIGFSGIVFGFVGFELVRYIPPDTGRHILNKRNIIFLIIWLFACLVLTELNVLNIGNAAHFGGMAGGFLIGSAIRYIKFKRLFQVLLGLTALFSIVQVFYSPWSDLWVHRDFMEKVLEFDEGAEPTEENTVIAYTYLQSGDDALIEKGLNYLKRLSAAGDLTSMNSLAWFYATTSDNKYQNGEEAVRLAESLCVQTNYDNYMYVDTLAAAYARAGNWDEAVSYQESAIGLLKKSGMEDQEGFNLRLDLYISRKAYTETRE